MKEEEKKHGICISAGYCANRLEWKKCNSQKFDDDWHDSQVKNEMFLVAAKPLQNAHFML